MGRNRKVPTLDEWLEHGGNLLAKLPERSKLHKEIKSGLLELHALNSEPAKNKTEITETLKSLNSTESRFKAKDKISNGVVEKMAGKSEWSLWLARFYQKKKDAKRSKFYVSDICHEQVELMSEQSGYKNLNKYLGQLPSVFMDNGIDQTRDLFDLRDLLAPFKDALKPTPSAELHAKDRIPEFSLLAIVKAVTKELSRLGIKNYRDLSSINKKRREADNYAESKREQLDEMQQQIDQLTRQRVIDLQKISSLKQEAHSDHNKIEELTDKLIKIKNSPSYRKAQKLSGKIKLSKP